jgi:hypothetical protein
VALHSTKMPFVGISSKRLTRMLMTADCLTALAANFHRASFSAGGCAPDQRRRL